MINNYINNSQKGNIRQQDDNDLIGGMLSGVKTQLDTLGKSK